MKLVWRFISDGGFLKLYEIFAEGSGQVITDNLWCRVCMDDIFYHCYAAFLLC